MRKTKLFITTLAMSMVLSSTALAGTWMQDSAVGIIKTTMEVFLLTNGFKILTENGTI